MMLLSVALWGAVAVVLWRLLPPTVVIAIAQPGVTVPPGVIHGEEAWVVVKETAQLRQLVLAPDGSIRQGVTAGEAVVINPPPGLTDGAPVRMRPR